MTITQLFAILALYSFALVAGTGLLVAIALLGDRFGWWRVER